MTPNRFPTPCVEYRTKFSLQELFKFPSFYWAPVLEYTLDYKGIGLDPLAGVILAGAPGNGRHTIANALSGTLAQSEKRRISYFLRASGAALDAEDVSDVCKELELAMAKPVRAGVPFCFLLDCPEDSRHSLAIQEFLRQKMAALSGGIFPIIITGSTANIIPDLQFSLMICQFERPDKPTREAWFLEALNGPRAIHFEEGNINHFFLGRNSEGFTWRQMTDLRSMLRRLAVMKYFQNPAYKTTGEPPEALITNGTIKLSAADVNTALACVRGQGASIAVPGAGAVQYVSAMPAAAAVSPATPVYTAASATPAPAPKTDTAPAPNTELTEEQKVDLKKAMEFHSHPEQMTPDQLFNVDDL